MHTIACTTGDDREKLLVIARLLIEKKLAACVQLHGPVTSVYEWQGAVEQSTEWSLQIKTLNTCLDEVERLVRLNHNYELPEFVAWPICGGSPEYLDWVSASVDAVRSTRIARNGPHRSVWQSECRVNNTGDSERL